MAKVAIIDGTGDYSDASYGRAMAQSFCNQMGLQLGPDGQYERGPSAEGARIVGRAERAAEFLRKARVKDPKVPLMLAGYSRGGSTAIMAAEMLKAEKIEVAALFLFDPVARHVWSGGEVIEANVKRVWAARRSLDRNLIDKYEGTIGPGWTRKSDWTKHNPMRPSFGTTGVEYRGPAHAYQQSTFRGSHGALGGVGWTHVTEDAACQQQVANWFNQAFAEVGLGVRLRSYPPNSKP